MEADTVRVPAVTRARRKRKETALSKNELQVLCRQHAPGVMEELLEIATGAERDSDKLAAIRLVLAYGFGNPEQKTESEHTLNINAKFELPEEIKQRLAAVTGVHPDQQIKTVDSKAVVIEAPEVAEEKPFILPEIPEDAD